MNTNLGQAAAIDPATGETTWVYRALEDGTGRSRGAATRGVGYWQDPERDDERVIVVGGEQLVGLDARTGEDGGPGALPSARPFFLFGR